MTYIDRIDTKGQVRQHVLHPRLPGRTVCGLFIATARPPSNIACCRRCERIAYPSSSAHGPSENNTAVVFESATF